MNTGQGICFHYDAVYYFIILSGDCQGKLGKFFFFLLPLFYFIPFFFLLIKVFHHGLKT